MYFRIIDRGHKLECSGLKRCVCALARVHAFVCFFVLETMTRNMKISFLKLSSEAGSTFLSEPPPLLQPRTLLRWVMSLCSPGLTINLVQG